ncbi:helix-turn-helix domain-containing protein [Pusillimonas caeni]|uniref:helix-turn-helix transcriptional regulator n=1 Tax=Pusillimonas caeni TaxID=1348472 RepID=UPI000E5994E1|nr:helix-turn-helix transcriptional regulator [Pusillimonas caeni]TFL11349.1 helix-turn-helix domain-containing protein [Pusillimonas caeni]
MAQKEPLIIEAPDLQQRVAQRVRAARAGRAMSMKQLARESGISLPYLSRVERGEGNISLAVLGKLAAALHLSADSMLADDDRYGADYALIVELLKRQSPARLREIRKALLEGGASGPGQAPRRIALVGLRGAGKSTLGPLLAQRLHLPFIELNQEVEKEAGIALDLIFSIYGQAGFRQLEKRCLDRVIAQYPEVVLATGGGIVVEPATYELLLHSFFCVWLHADPHEHFRRVMAQHDARIATPELHKDAMANITGALDARRKLYALAHADVDTTHREVDALVQQLEELIQKHPFGQVGSALAQALCA